ncbi:MAG: TolC family protein [Sphingobacteriales bacterium]|nr:TolC family protein [Sphingobacteriales bacterium]MBI3719101.1 TolC family protein [Sphingobacteriales bacterium]
MKQKLFFLLVILSAGWSVNAQDNTRHLSLQEAVAAATANNNAIKLSSLDEQIAKAKFKQTDAIFLPQANFSYTAFTTNNPLNAFGFKLQQKTITAADFNPVLLNNPGATPDFTTKFELQQPLVNIDMLYQRKGAAKQMEMYSLISQRTKEYLAFETAKAYLQLQMLYEVDKVLKEALTTAKSMQKTTSNYFDQGLIQKSDLLNAELQVMNTETQIKNVQSNIADASDMLSLLMGNENGVVYTTDTINKEIQQGTDTLQLSNSRADFKALQKGMEGYDMMIKSSKMSYLPRLNAFASYQWNDKAMFGYNANAYLAGIQLSWNIFNGNRTKNSITQQTLEKAKLVKQLDQQKSEAQLQINHAKRQLDDAAFAMKQQQLAVGQASESLRVLQNRFTQGLVKTTDVLMAQTQLSQQQLGTVQAVFNYDVAMAYLQFLTTNN